MHATFVKSNNMKYDIICNKNLPQGKKKKKKNLSTSGGRKLTDIRKMKTSQDHCPLPF